MKMSNQQPVSDLNGLNGQLCNWAVNLKLLKVPKDIQFRSELITLDGIGCRLVGAHLPWSEKAVKALFGLEPTGSCLLLGWENEMSASAAALFNNTFIRVFELYD